jgi:hypothetical protein
MRLPWLGCGGEQLNIGFCAGVFLKKDPMFSTEKIDALLESKTYPAISIYLPTSRAGQVAEDRIRLKNQLQRAEEKLEALGFNRRAFDPWLKPAYELVEDDEFLNHLSDGLALYIAPDFFQVEEAPIDFKE